MGNANIYFTNVEYKNVASELVSDAMLALNHMIQGLSHTQCVAHGVATLQGKSNERE